MLRDESGSGLVHNPSARHVSVPWLVPNFQEDRTADFQQEVLILHAEVLPLLGLGSEAVPGYLGETGEHEEPFEVLGHAFAFLTLIRERKRKAVPPARLLVLLFLARLLVANDIAGFGIAQLGYLG